MGDLEFKVTSIIHDLAASSNISVTQVVSILSPNILPLEDLGNSNVVDMNPLSNYIDAITSLINILDWTYVGLITVEHSVSIIELRLGIIELWA